MQLRGLRTISPDILLETMRLNISIPLQECSDPTVLGNLLAIFRELLSARTEWRPAALHHVMDLEATEVISRLLVRVCKPNSGTPTLSDHSFICCFWILSALATKGESIIENIMQGQGQTLKLEKL